MQQLRMFRFEICPSHQLQLESCYQFDNVIMVEKTPRCKASKKTANDKHTQNHDCIFEPGAICRRCGDFPSSHVEALTCTAVSFEQVETFSSHTNQFRNRNAVFDISPAGAIVALVAEGWMVTKVKDGGALLELALAV